MIPTSSSASNHHHHPNVLLLATGSVATIKLPLLVAQLLTYPLNLQVILTPTAHRFLTASDISALQTQVKIWRDEDEWNTEPPWQRGDKVLHIELRKWADLLLIAPLSANSLASMAGGLCSGLGMCVVRAWDTRGVIGDRGVEGIVEQRVGEWEGEEGEGEGEGEEGEGEEDENEDEDEEEGRKKRKERRRRRRRKMIFVAPAMNTHMYLHPLTGQHLSVLRSWDWIQVLDPVEKLLACGDLGTGGMMEVEGIVEAVVEQFGIPVEPRVK